MKILVLSSIDKSALARLASEHDVVVATGLPDAEVRSLVVDRQIIVFRSGVAISSGLMASAPDLELLVRGGSGFDNVDMDYVTAHGIRFVRIPEPGARAVAELTFGLMLMLARGLLPADQAWRQGRWVKNDVVGYLLRGKVLGIVGAGNIGVQVGALGAAWGMNVVGCVGRPRAAVALELRERGMRLTTFDEVVSTADFLSVHVSLSAATRNLIDGSVLARMKPGSFLLNLARGGVVDEVALRAELVSGARIRGAALDVHVAEGNGRISPLADLPNVVLTPHIGSTTVDTQREIGDRIVDIIAAHSAAARPTLGAAVG